MNSPLEVGFLMNGVDRGTPGNAPELQIINTWSENIDDTGAADNSEAEISSNELEFSLEGADYINTWVADGLTGGVGIFEGIPYDITLYDGITKTSFPFYIDLTNKAKFKNTCQVTALLEKRQSLNWINGVADSFSFAYLADPNIGIITATDYVRIPYVLNYRPEAFALSIISVSLFMMTKELVEAIKNATDGVADAAEAIGNIPFALGSTISAIAKAVALIVYAIAILIGVINLMTDLINQLFPPVRRYLGMKVKTMFEKGCQFLGLTFSSSIFNHPKWKNLTYLPAKDKAGGIFGAVKGTGHPNAQSSIYTFGDLIRQFKKFFNAEIKIVNNVLYLERRDFWTATSTWILPDVETNQSDRNSDYEHNTLEVISNYLFSFTTDIQDQNTVENFKGTNYQVITQPISVIDQSKVAIKGLSQCRFPFALAQRKDKLTFTENALKGLAGIVDGLVNFLGGNSTLANTIQNRVGTMSLSSDAISVEKLLIIDNEKIPAAEADQLNAKDLWDGFHFINSFVEIVDPVTGQIIHNQALVYNNVLVDFCYQDYLKVIHNNKFKDTKGREGTLLRLEWNVFSGTANITYKIKELYTKNLKLAFNEGQ